MWCLALSGQSFAPDVHFKLLARPGFVIQSFFGAQPVKPRSFIHATPYLPSPFLPTLIHFPTPPHAEHACIQVYRMPSACCNQARTQILHTHFSQRKRSPMLKWPRSFVHSKPRLGIVTRRHTRNNRGGGYRATNEGVTQGVNSNACNAWRAARQSGPSRATAPSFPRPPPPVAAPQAPPKPPACRPCPCRPLQGPGTA